MDNMGEKPQPKPQEKHQQKPIDVNGYYKQQPVNAVDHVAQAGADKGRLGGIRRALSHLIHRERGTQRIESTPSEVVSYDQQSGGVLNGKDAHLEELVNGKIGAIQTRIKDYEKMGPIGKFFHGGIKYEREELKSAELSLEALRRGDRELARGELERSILRGIGIIKKGNDPEIGGAHHGVYGGVAEDILLLQRLDPEKAEKAAEAFRRVGGEIQLPSAIQKKAEGREGMLAISRDAQKQRNNPDRSKSSGEEHDSPQERAITGLEGFLSQANESRMRLSEKKFLTPDEKDRIAEHTNRIDQARDAILQAQIGNFTPAAEFLVSTTVPKLPKMLQSKNPAEKDKLESLRNDLPVLDHVVAERFERAYTDALERQNLPR